MRDIKFRAWNIYEKKMYNCNDLPVVAFEGSKHPIMQYTGLKDKNGKEIYEGDVVKQSVHIFRNGNDFEDDFEDDFYEIGIVKIIASMGVVITNIIKTREDVNDKEKQKGLVKNVRKYRSEVIGNVFENPNLLSEGREI